MIGFIFDLIGACSHFLWQALCAVLNFGFGVFSALCSVLFWPIRVLF